MRPKPSLNLSVLGELRRSWRAKLGHASAKEHELHYYEHESEERRYRLIFRPGAPTAVSGIIFLISFRAVISVEERSLLLLLARSTLPLFVILCHAEGKTDKERDQEELRLREALAEMGFQADDARFFHEPKEHPSRETMWALFDELDAHHELRPPQETPRPQPTKPGEPLAGLLSLLKLMVRPVTYLQTIRSSTEALFTRSIATQLGGMPYLESHEDWPSCASCSKKQKIPLRFLWQIDAADLHPKIKGAGLYVFFACGNNKAHPDPSLVIRHYEHPERTKRQGIRTEALGVFSATEQPITPSAVKRTLELQVPAYKSLESSPSSGRYTQTLPFIFWKELSSQGKSPEELYQKLCHLLGVTQAVSDFVPGQPIQAGGYSYGGACLLPTCAKCYAILRTLANVHFVKGLWFPFGYQALQFFICECSPANVSTLVQRQLVEEEVEDDDDEDNDEDDEYDEDRYESSLE